MLSLQPNVGHVVTSRQYVWLRKRKRQADGHSLRDHLAFSGYGSATDFSEKSWFREELFTLSAGCTPKNCFSTQRLRLQL